MMSFFFRPVDSAILIYFRLGAGLLLAQELINGLIIGKFHHYVDPKFHFSYLFFDWIKPWPYWGMVLHYALTVFSGFAVAFNFHYNFFSKILFLGYTLLFLFEQSEYINHAYLYCLISFWIMILPLNKRTNSFPAWMLNLILFHMALVYFFGGIAKLNTDWLSGAPMGIFLHERQVPALKIIYHSSWSPLFFSYGGLIFDLFIVPLMIFRRTRLLGFIFSLIFHLSNVFVFGLATFPWFSLFLTSMFFDPSWPRKIPLLRNYMPWGIGPLPEYRSNKLIPACLIFYAFVHLTLPLRHLAYPGKTSWTEEGHMFSWRMMLRDKKGVTHFFIKKKNSDYLIPVDSSLFLGQRQLDGLVGKPDLILQFAHFLRDYYQSQWKSEVEVYASSRVSLNGHPPREMIRPGTDLAKEKRSLLPYQWITEFNHQVSAKNLLSR